jgi:hypothetical protein
LIRAPRKKLPLDTYIKKASVTYMIKSYLITTLITLSLLTGCLQTNQSRGGLVLPLTTQNLSAKTIENDGNFAGIQIFDEVPPGFKMEPRPRQLVKLYRAENYQGYDEVILSCGSLTDAPGDGKDYVLGIKLKKYVGTPPYRGEIIAEHNRFVEKISTRTKTAPWNHFQYDETGLSYWKIKSPEYYKSNPEEFKENIAVSNYIDGILLVWADMRRIINKNSYHMTVEVESPRLDILEKKEKERASNVF